MGVVLRRYHRLRFIPTLVVVVFLFFFFSSFSTAASLNLLSGGLGESRKEPGESGLIPGRIIDQKRLGGPGSVPPTCRSKCGKCWPCKAVHVPIQPGLLTPLQYYPEAWRCKCGNKIFMP